MISRTKEFCPLKSTLLNILTNELGAGEGQSLFIERSSPRLETLKDSLLYSSRRHPGKKKTRISVAERLALKKNYVKRNMEDTSSLRRVMIDL